MDVLISRQAAIEEFKTPGAVFTYGEGTCSAIISRLMLVPPAQPEQKTGKWIEKEICLTKQKEEMQVAKCSNCGKYLTTPHFYSFTHYSFCPSCGAKME